VLTGFDHTFSFEAVGESEDITPLNVYNFYSPGSKFFDNQLQFNRPIYDNPLGLFTVLEPPLVQYFDETFLEGELGDPDFGQVTQTRYKVSSDLKYRINQTAGLNELPISINAALVWTDGCITYNDQGDIDSVQIIASPTSNLYCFNDQVVRLRTKSTVDGLEGSRCNGVPQVQVVATLEEEGGDAEILFSARYPVSLEKVEPTNAWGLGEIAEPDPEPLSSCSGFAFPPPVSDIELFMFCRDRYDPVLTLVEGPDAETKDDVKNLTSLEINAEIDTEFEQDVFPNPVIGRLWLEIPENLVDQNLTFLLSDITGKTLMRFNRTYTSPGRNVLPIDWSTHNVGMYVLTITDENMYRRTIQITKQ
ncbi:MAG: T9SS type A sorting domain-containing protein, partial [Bacteroidota bacterium]